MTDPDMGSWTYAYNAFGELIHQQDAKAQVTTMTYDVLGRMKTRTRTEGTTTWNYDSGTKALGKPSSVSSPGYSAVIWLAQESAEFKPPNFAYSTMGGSGFADVRDPNDTRR